MKIEHKLELLLIIGFLLIAALFFVAMVLVIATAVFALINGEYFKSIAATLISMLLLKMFLAVEFK